MTDILSEFVSHPTNVIVLFSFLTFLTATLRHVVLTKILLKSGKKHAKVTNDLTKF